MKSRSLRWTRSSTRWIQVGVLASLAAMAMQHVLPTLQLPAWVSQVNRLVALAGIASFACGLAQLAASRSQKAAADARAALAALAAASLLEMVWELAALPLLTGQAVGFFALAFVLNLMGTAACLFAVERAIGAFANVRRFVFKRESADMAVDGASPIERADMLAWDRLDGEFDGLQHIMRRAALVYCGSLAARIASLAILLSGNPVATVFSLAVFYLLGLAMTAGAIMVAWALYRFNDMLVTLDATFAETTRDSASTDPSWRNLPEERLGLVAISMASVAAVPLAWQAILVFAS